MWEFPQTELQAGESHEVAALRWLKQSTGLNVALDREIITVGYSVTRFRLTLVALGAHSRPGRLRLQWYQRAAWVPIGKIVEYPMSIAQGRIVAALLDQQRGLF